MPPRRVGAPAAFAQPQLRVGEGHQVGLRVPFVAHRVALVALEICMRSVKPLVPVFDLGRLLRSIGDLQFRTSELDGRERPQLAVGCPRPDDTE